MFATACLPLKELKFSSDKTPRHFIPRGRITVKRLTRNKLQQCLSLCTPSILSLANIIFVSLGSVGCYTTILCPNSRLVPGNMRQIDAFDLCPSSARNISFTCPKIVLNYYDTPPQPKEDEQVIRGSCGENGEVYVHKRT